MTPKLRGDRVRELRTALSLSQYDVSDELRRMGAEVKQSWLSQVERGGAGLRPEALTALAFLLGTSTDYLLGVTDDPSPREDLGAQVMLIERDEGRREELQRLFRAVEKLAPELKDEYYAMIEVLYRGLAARGKPRDN